MTHSGHACAYGARFRHPPQAAELLLHSLRSKAYSWTVRISKTSPIVAKCALCFFSGGVLLTTLACSSTPASQHPPETHAEAMSIETLDDPERDAFAMPKQVVEALPLTPAMVVADIGAGSGYFSRRIAARVPDGRVIALDVDLEFKHHIETKRDAWGTPNIEARLVLNDNPVLQEKTVDLVFVSNTYPYILDRKKYFSIVHRSLRAHGLLAIIDFREDAECESSPTCPSPASRVPREQTIAEMKASGFTLDREESFLPFQYFLIFRREDAGPSTQPLPARN